MSHVPRTFAFDTNIPQSEYDQYINPDDLLNESFEKVKGDFEFYRKRKVKDIIKEEQQEKDMIGKKHLNSLKTIKLPQSNLNQRIRLPQNQVISELDPVSTMVWKTREKIRYLQNENDKLKKRVSKPNFGQDHQTTTKTIQKTNLIKDVVFNDDDINRLIQQEEEAEQKNDRQEISKKASSKYSETHIQILQRGFTIRAKSKGKGDPNDRLSKSYKSIRTGFKFDKVKQNSQLLHQQEVYAQQSVQNNEKQDFMQAYLLNVMTKPALDKKTNLIKQIGYHQNRIKEMQRKTISVFPISK